MIGIYFLLHKKKVVYVGQSKCLPARLNGHSDKQYDSVRIICCDQSLLKQYEERWIIRFSPKYNIKHIPLSKIRPIFPVKLGDKELKMLKKLCKKSRRKPNNQIIWAIHQHYYRQFAKTKATDYP